MATIDKELIYWVIEFVGEFPRLPGVVNYCCIRDVEDPSRQGFMDWTDNVHDAVKFARQIDAERFAKVYWWDDREHIAISEHMDCPSPYWPGIPAPVEPTLPSPTEGVVSAQLKIAESALRMVAFYNLEANEDEAPGALAQAAEDCAKALRDIASLDVTVSEGSNASPVNTGGDK